MRVLVSFNVDENGHLNLESSRMYPEKDNLNSFIRNANQAFEKVAELSRSTTLIKPALDENNKPVVIKYAIPIIFNMGY